MTQPDRIHVRPAADVELPGIVASWRRSWRLSGANRRLNQRRYNAEFDEVVLGGILADEEARLLVAEGSAGELWGWLAYTPGVPLVHYCYVRSAYRRRGLLWILLAAAGVRDAFAFTCRPQEYPHRLGRRLNMEDRLLDRLLARRIIARYVRPEDVLPQIGRSR